MVYRIKLFNQMSIAVLIEEHLSKPTQFGKPSKLIGLDTGTYETLNTDRSRHLSPFLREGGRFRFEIRTSS